MKLALVDLFENLSSGFPDTPFEVEFWDGTKTKFGSGDNKFRLILKDQNIVKKIISEKSLGFGEEFMEGNIEIEGKLQDLLKMAFSEVWINLPISFKTKIRIFLNYIFSLGFTAKAKKNIAYHYDLGNDFYSLWLDETLTYTCAYFKKEDNSLREAQLNKYEHVARKLQLKEGESLIDVGCGWGGMMFYAAENYGVRCDGYTLSKQQYDYVVAKIKAKKLNGLVRVYLKDYREISGEFDKFVSIGMLEAVGKKFLPVFFDIVKKSLKPQGIGLIHTIGFIKDEPGDPWIVKYIFPGGFIPTLPMITETMNQRKLFSFDVENMRMHYPKTLDKWIENFERNIKEIKSIMVKSLGDKDSVQKFIRMWRLYLNVSSAAFKMGNNHLYQITFSNGLNNNLPLIRSYIYDID